MKFNHFFAAVTLVTAGLLMLNSAAAVEVGEAAPDFTLPDIHEGKSSLTLSDLRGKVVYVDFWASWCAPCLRSLPQINDLYTKLKDSGFEVVAVNVDNPIEDGLDFLLDTPLDYRIVADPDGVTPEAYGLIGMPTSYLVDRNGIVQLIHMGFKDNDLEIIEREVLKVLEEN